MNSVVGRRSSVVGYFISLVFFLAMTSFVHAAALPPELAGLVGSAPEFHMPKVADVTLSNGMHCFFLEDHLLPLFRFSLLFPGGSVYDPPERVGLSGLLATMLRTGGTRTTAAKTLDALLDAQAISIDIGMGRENGDASIKALASAQTEALQQLFAMLYEPAFDPERLTLAKNRLLESLRRRNDAPAAIGARVFRKLIYGKQSPWAATPTIAHVAEMNTEDLKALHATLLAPSQMLCAAAGDFRTKDLVRSLEKIMAQYPERAKVPHTPPPAAPVPQPGVWLVEKSVPQSVVDVGHIGISRDNPDKYPLLVMNDILGSPATFTSWLVERIRTQRGLAYEAWSQLEFGASAVAGVFHAHAKTRADATGESLALMRSTITEMAQANTVTEGDVDAIKAATMKRLVFAYEDSYQIVADMMRYVFFGFPANYIDLYRDEIAKVKLSDVQRVARQYVQPDQLTTVLVGDPKILLPQLKDATAVHTVDIEHE